jgi:hypothetical protein
MGTTTASGSGAETPLAPVCLKRRHENSTSCGRRQAAGRGARRSLLQHAQCGRGHAPCSTGCRASQARGRGGRPGSRRGGASAAPQASTWASGTSNTVMALASSPARGGARWRRSGAACRRSQPLLQRGQHLGAAAQLAWPSRRRGAAPVAGPLRARAASGRSASVTAAPHRERRRMGGGGRATAQVEAQVDAVGALHAAGAACAIRWRLPATMADCHGGIVGTGHHEPQVVAVLALVVVVDAGVGGNPGGHGLQPLGWHGHGGQQRCAPGAGGKHRPMRLSAPSAAAGRSRPARPRPESPAGGDARKGLAHQRESALPGVEQREASCVVGPRPASGHLLPVH